MCIRDRLPLHQDPQLQPGRHPQRAALHLVDERHVQLPRSHHPQQGVGGHVHHQRGLEVRHPAVDPAQPPRYRPVGRGADVQPRPAGQRPGLGDERGHLGQQRAGPAQDRAAERGGPAAGALTQEQLAVQGAFDAAQLGRQGGLAHAELPRGFVQTAGVGNGAQCAQVPHLELHDPRVGRSQRTAPATDTPPNPAILMEVDLPKTPR